jgi:hypothetical protein
MTYLGNSPTTQSFISGTDYFNGTGAQTAFTLTRTVASVNDIEAVVNNVVQVPNDAYTISGTTITFTSAPSAGTQNVYVRYLSTTTQAITPSQNTVSWSTLNADVQQDLGISFKNRIINGAMVISQRNGTTAVNNDTTGTQYSLDRWGIYGTQSAKFSAGQYSTAPTGFNNSIGISSNSAYTLNGTDTFWLQQQIEGYNISDLGFGTSSAKTVTLSFWVRSSLTGTFGGTLRNADNTRCYPYSYTINTANTWEQKSITITGCLDGTWGTTNGSGIKVLFSLGSNYLGTAGAWTSSYVEGATGQTSLVGTSGANLYITGVQLEVGTQATTFTTAGGSYGAELALCQRYFYQSTVVSTTMTISSGTAYNSASIYNSNMLYFPVTMRAIPTASYTGQAYSSDGLGGSYVSTINTWQLYTWGMLPNDTTSSGLTTGRLYYITVGGTGNYVRASAEL